MTETRRVDARLRLLPEAPRALKAGEAVAWHTGSAEVVARVRYLETEPVAPGAAGWVQWRFDTPVALARGDRYVIRRLSPPLTLGGGTVVRATTRHLPRGDAATLRALQAAATADPEALVLAATDAEGPLRLPALVTRLGLPADEVAAGVERARAAGRLVTLGEGLCTPRSADALRHQLVAAVAAHHARAPVGGGPDRTALRAELGLAAPELAALIDLAQAAGEVRTAGARVALATHHVVLSPAQAAAAILLLAALDAGGTSPPGLEASAQAVGAEQAVIEALVADGRLVRLASDLALSGAGYARWTAETRALFATRPHVTVADVRDRLHTSRKYALALLEYLDAQGVTRRIGDARVLIARDPGDSVSPSAGRGSR
ncbi:MAG: SelB C-terminal domain-containing protein [Actinobacteria bacterium]|nr:SelB C-terminal domain-containing protein [Actinomycetota bacterium]